MARRTPKAIGTAAESAARDWLIGDGWLTCRRQPLAGARDEGDLAVCDMPDRRIIAEVKGGSSAESASDTLIREWLAQTDTECVHAGADLGVLIVRRHRRPVALWDAWMIAADWALLLTGDSILSTDAPWPLRASLRDWSALAQGWADS